MDVFRRSLVMTPMMPVKTERRAVCMLGVALEMVFLKRKRIVCVWKMRRNRLGDEG